MNAKPDEPHARLRNKRIDPLRTRQAENLGVKSYQRVAIAVIELLESDGVNVCRRPHEQRKFAPGRKPKPLDDPSRIVRCVRDVAVAPVAR